MKCVTASVLRAAEDPQKRGDVTALLAARGKFKAESEHSTSVTFKMRGHIDITVITVKDCLLNILSSFFFYL